MPVDVSPKFPQANMNGNAQISPACSSSKGQRVTSSYCPAGGALPALKPESEAAVLSDPTPCCSQQREDHCPVVWVHHLCVKRWSANQAAVLQWPPPAGSPTNRKGSCHFCHHCHHCCGGMVSCPHLLSCLALPCY